MLKIPEYIIHNQILRIISFLKKDLKENPQNSLLQNMTSGASFENLNFWEQAKFIFESEEEIKIDLIYNLSKDTYPNIYINSPSEATMGGGNGMGVDEGYEGVFLTRRYNATYDIVINSNNSNEVVILYHILRSLLTSLTNHLSTLGLENISISGQDLTPNSEIESQQRGFYTKVLKIYLEYETQSLNLNLYKNGFKDIFFIGKLK
jgi:hypothetical protein